MMPLGTVGDVTDINGPLILTRHNSMYPAAAITGDTMPRRQLRRRSSR